MPALPPTPARALRPGALLLLIALLAPRAAEAQVRLVDEGTFTWYASGARIGREDFSIRAVPGAPGGTFVAQGNSLIGPDRVSVALTADSSGFPMRYTLEATVDGKVVETLTGESRGGVWLGRAVREQGESAREFRLPPDVLVAEEGVVHHIWFLLRRGTGPAATLLPRSFALHGVTVEDAGPDQVVLGLREVAARRWVIRPAGDSLPPREAWTDLKGRLLRLSIPSQSLDALRDEPPG